MNPNHSIWLAEFVKLMETTMPQPEQEFVQAMMDIVERHGKLGDNDGKGIWVGYVSAEDNDNAEIGVKCSNCAHYEGGNMCHIVARSIEPNGYCRLAAIPDGVVNATKQMMGPDDDPEDETA